MNNVEALKRRLKQNISYMDQVLCEQNPYGTLTGKEKQPMTLISGVPDQRFNKSEDPQTSGCLCYTYASKRLTATSSFVEKDDKAVYYTPIDTNVDDAFDHVENDLNLMIGSEILNRSGAKIVASSRSEMLGGYNQIDTQLKGVPTHRISQQLLGKCARIMREEMSVQGFGDTGKLTLICGSEASDTLVSDNSGRLPYGVRTYTVPNPLRLDLDKNGVLKVIDPKVYRKPANFCGMGTSFVRHAEKEWVDAEFEVAVLCGKDSFELKLSEPEIKLVIEGVNPGVRVDIIAALRPIYPWSIVPIVFKRKI